MTLNTESKKGIKSAYRNVTLDLFKLFASYMVIFIHFPFEGLLGQFVNSLARFAVPFFFISSGFFCYNNDIQKIKGKLKHVGLLALLSSAIYIPFTAFKEYFYNGSIDCAIDYLKGFLNIKYWMNLLLFNETKSSIHLWFLFALIYVYLIQYFVRKFSVSDKAVVAVSVIGLLTYFVLMAVSISGIPIHNRYSRNFITIGYPFFVLGMLVKKHKTKIEKIPFAVLMTAIVLGTGLTLLSSWKFGIREMYVGSILITVSIYVIAVKYAKGNYPSILIKLSLCSTNIYIFHMLIGNVIFIALGILGLNVGQALSIFVCVFSTAFALAIEVFKDKVLLFKKSDNKSVVS